jgi:hypothetical protein
MLEILSIGGVMKKLIRKVIIYFKRRRWYKRYTPIYIKLKKDWKVGMEGSISGLGPFVVQAIDPEEQDLMWVTFKK